MWPVVDTAVLDVDTDEGGSDGLCGSRERRKSRRGERDVWERDSAWGPQLASGCGWLDLASSVGCLASQMKLANQLVRESVAELFFFSYISYNLAQRAIWPFCVGYALREK